MFQFNLFTPNANASKMAGSFSKIKKLAESTKVGVETLELECTVEIKKQSVD